jgi:uncharacterized damage-inducible protein DinB
MTEHVLSTLDNSRKYTLAVADAMPDSGYNTRPSEEVWDFRELLHHIAYGIQWWEDNYIHGKKTGWDPPPVKATKKEVMEYLENAYASLKKTMMKAGKDAEKINGFHATLDHITHHRGQAVTYLRYRGITPPAYVY